MSDSKKLAIVRDDPWLDPYEPDLVQRLDRFRHALSAIRDRAGSIKEYALGHQYFGFHYDRGNKGWHYREWAPRASALFLTGDFNGWNRHSHPLEKKTDGTWEIFVPDAGGTASPLGHESLVKVSVEGSNGRRDRIPAWIRRVVQDKDSKDFSGQIWSPPDAFRWTDKSFSMENLGEPFIYECHVGIAREEGGIGTYPEFTANVLPRIQKAGYNCIQLMAIQEHPYYGSFGYHVANFFAPSSRFGTPDELKALINRAHELGIAVLLDVVHSHAVKNMAEGLAEFDGMSGLYFHAGERGEHAGWDSKLFDYGKGEVRHFLLSNLAYWLEEFHFDGFRFDGVTSMLYHHHGEGVAFDHYDRYFREGVDWDSVTYLQLASTLIQEIKPGALRIAEDMSGMPGLCRPVTEGGMGFDYRLGMGIPDYWIKLLKHERDEDWDLDALWNTLTNRRQGERTIAYAESHDQALVGDKSIAFWLMDKEMYEHMRADDSNPVIDRGIALHKMIRMITAALGGEGYLNFIGNEFGHPEWLDFPREGNNWSYHYARRQWSLVDHPELKYRQLGDFDRAMVELLKGKHVLAPGSPRLLNMDLENKVMIFERAGLVFLFNFHVDRSIPDYRFAAPAAGSYRVVLNSDVEEFGGFGRVDSSLKYETFDEQGGPKLSLYLTNRTALALAPIGVASEKSS